MDWKSVIECILKSVDVLQELSGMEEKMEYQLEERTRDMQDMLETCQTRVSPRVTLALVTVGHFKSSVIQNGSFQICSMLVLV